MDSFMSTAWETTRATKFTVLLLIGTSFWLLVGLYTTPPVYERPAIADAYHAVQDRVAILRHQRDDATVQVVLISGWRSGSSFSFELIASHPSVFALFEPLGGYKSLYLNKLRNWNSIPDAKDYIRHLLLCNFNERQIEVKVKHRDFILGRSTIFQRCQSKVLSVKSTCDGKYLTSLCQSFPVTLHKFVRLPMNLTADLLADPALPNLHVVYIPRDPRSVMSSRWDRKRTGWCNKSVCNSSKVVCQDMADDLSATQQLQEQYPTRVHLVRYEELALNPKKVARHLFVALGIEYHERVDEFIQSHTTNQSLRKEDTFRVSSERVMAWVHEMNWTTVEQVQVDCQEVMASLGYLLAPTPFNLTLGNVLKFNSSVFV